MKKQNLFLLLCFIAITNMNAQSWNLGLNTIGGTPPNFGTLNNHPINFYTNGVKRAAFSTAGVLNISSLSGSGNRFLQVNSSGDLIEWTGNSGDGTKALFGDNTFKTLPFTFNTAVMIVNNGLKLGIGQETPTEPLDVNGNGKFSGQVTASQVNASNGFMFATNNGLSYNTTGNYYIVGKQSGISLPTFNWCGQTNNASNWLMNGQGGFLSSQDYLAPGSTAATNVKASMAMFVLPSNGSGYIDVDGKDNNNQSNVSLNLNNFCGKTTNINTSSNGGVVNIGSSAGTSQVNLGNSVHTGNFVRMARHLEIGDPTAGIQGAPNNIALDLHVNSGKGIKVRTSSNNGNSGYNLNDMITVESLVDPGTGAVNASVFNVNSEGRTTLNSFDFTSFVIKNLYSSGNPETFRVYGDGLTEMIPTNAKALSVRNAANSNNETFSIDRNGYTEIKVRTTMPNPYGSVPRVMTIRDLTVAGGKDIFAITAAGTVYAREIEINLSTNFPDYVFDPNYKLLSISELGNFIQTNRHLPGFEKGDYYEKAGLNVNTMFIKQQEKIEELTLYIIQLEKRLQAVESAK